MFEKEANRSFDELEDRGIGDDWEIEDAYKNGFSNGAEFGYNKAFVEADKNLKAVVADFNKAKEELEKENEYLCTKCEKLEETLKKVRVALIQERTANIMNYGKGGVEMFSNIFEVLKGVSND